MCIANWEHIHTWLVGRYVRTLHIHTWSVGRYVQPVLLQFLALLKNYLVNTRVAAFFLPPHGLGIRLYKIQITFITAYLWGIVYTFDGHVYH